MSASAILSAPNALAAPGLAVSDDRAATGGVFAELLATETTDAAVFATPVARTPSLSIVIDAPADADAESVEAAAGLDIIGGIALATPTFPALPPTAAVPLEAGAGSEDRPPVDEAPAFAIGVPALPAEGFLSVGGAPVDTSAGLSAADDATGPIDAGAVSAGTPSVETVRVAQAAGTVTSAQAAPASSAARITEAPAGEKSPPAQTQPTVDADAPASVAAPRQPNHAAQSGIDLVKAALAWGGQPSAPPRVNGVRSPIVANATAASAEVAEARVDADRIVETPATRQRVGAVAPAISAPPPPLASRAAAAAAATNQIPTAPSPSRVQFAAPTAIVADQDLQAVPASGSPPTPSPIPGTEGVTFPAPATRAAAVVAPAKADPATNASVQETAPRQSQDIQVAASGTVPSPAAQSASTAVPAAIGFEAVPTAAAPALVEPETPVVQGLTAVPETAPTPPVAETGLSSLSRATIETTAQLAAQITRRLEGRSTRFEMALTPDGLGRVDVSLDIDADGQLAARLAFDNPLAATDLRGRADELRRQLEDAGFTLARDALEFSGRDGSSGGGQAFDRRQGRAAAYASRNAAAEAEALSAPAPWINPQQTPRGVDLKV